MNERPSPPHYFAAAPTAASRERTVVLALPRVTLSLTTDSGVFAAGAVDPGTKLLLLEAPLPPPSARTVADVGCGYGAIAVAIASQAPHVAVWAVDVNERARALCRANAAANRVGERVHVIAPAEVPADLAIDTLYSNPPIRIGKAPLRTLVSSWLARLSPSGAAFLVVQKNLGADTLAAWIESQGYGVTRLVSRRGYRVLEVRR